MQVGDDPEVRLHGRMEDPSEGFGEAIGLLDDSRDMVQDNMAVVFPVLDSKGLDVNVPAAFGGDTVVDKCLVCLGRDVCKQYLHSDTHCLANHC